LGIKTGKLESVFKIKLRPSELGNRFNKIGKSVEKALLKYPKSVKPVAFLDLRRIKWKRPTMATCHACKNLRLKNGDGKPAQASKARLRHYRLLLPALAFVK
jgi:hypothetical protein